MEHAYRIIIDPASKSNTLNWLKTHSVALRVAMPVGIKTPNIDRNPKDTATTAYDIRKSSLQKHPPITAVVS